MHPYGLLIILSIVVIIIWLSWFIYKRNNDKQILKNFRLLQERYGLKVDFSKKNGFIHYPVSEGKLKTYPVQLGTVIEHDGKKKFASTFVKLTCSNPAGLVFLIVRRTPANKTLYSRNAGTTGDQEFDEKFIVNSGNSGKMIELLNFSIKYKMLQTANVDFKGAITLDKNILVYTERGSIITKRDLLRIELVLHLLCEIADGLKFYTEEQRT